MCAPYGRGAGSVWLVISFWFFFWGVRSPYRIGRRIVLIAWQTQKAPRRFYSLGEQIPVQSSIFGFDARCVELLLGRSCQALYQNELA